MTTARKPAASRVRGLRTTRIAAVHNEIASGEGLVTARLFARAHAHCDPSDAAQAVTAALDKINSEVSQVVLPAGFGILPEVTLEDDWSHLHVSEIQSNAKQWAEDFRRAIARPLEQIPIIVGLDAKVRWPGDEPFIAVQTLAIIGARGLEALG